MHRCCSMFLPYITSKSWFYCLLPHTPGSLPLRFWRLFSLPHLPIGTLKLHIWPYPCLCGFWKSEHKSSCLHKLFPYWTSSLVQHLLLLFFLLEPLEGKTPDAIGWIVHAWRVSEAAALGVSVPTCHFDKWASSFCTLFLCYILRPVFCRDPLQTCLHFSGQCLLSVIFNQSLK